MFWRESYYNKGHHDNARKKFGKNLLTKDDKICILLVERKKCVKKEIIEAPMFAICKPRVHQN